MLDPPSHKLRGGGAMGMRWVAVGLLVVSLASSACGDAHAGPGDAADAAVALFNAANNPFPCLDPQPDESFLPGVVRCANGMRIRPRPSECAPSAIPSTDECLRPSDCGGNRPCYCDAPDVAGGNYCGARPADTDCLSDLDCDYGFHCAVYSAGFSDWVTLRQRCQRPVDECAVEIDCASSDYDAGRGYYGPVCQDDAQGRVCCDPNNDWSCIRG